MRLIAPGVVAAGLVLALTACTNPYDPGQRAVGGGLLGAGAGAAIGGAVGGGHGAALGAAIGGATGAVTGAATTPPPPPPPSGYGYGPGRVMATRHRRHHPVTRHHINPVASRPAVVINRKGISDVNSAVRF
jgi:hypothetical protein